MIAMKPHRLFPVLLLVLTNRGTIPAEAPVLPPGDKEPLLRVEAGGPTSYVTSLVFSADGKTLYSGGWDKVVRVWSLNDKGQFVPDHVPAYRLPIGPGLDGAINALALSEDGVWLAAAGQAVARGRAGFRQTGSILPTIGGMSPEMRRDQGTIYVFNTRDQSVRLLRGHEGPVTALAFAPPYRDRPLLLLSAAREGDFPGPYHLTARVWDVDKGETVASMSGTTALSALRPGVAIWHTGKRATQVRAAFALSDKQLSVWDVDRPAPNFFGVKAPQDSITVVHLPGPGPGGADRLLTADWDHDRGRLTLWDVTAAGKLERITPEPKKIAHGNTFSRALGRVASKADGRPDLAAVAVLRRPLNGPSQYRLQLLDLSPQALGTVRADQVLWGGSLRQPALATSPHGQYLAVAGNEDQEIRVYSIPALLRGGMAPFQTLRSSGIAFHHASFLTKGNELALMLNRSARTRPGEPPPAPDRARGNLVFAFGHPGLSPDLAGWKTAAPDLTGWTAVAEDRAGRFVSVRRDGQKPVRVNLPQKQELSDYALLSPHGAVKVPLLALATHLDGQPELGIYDASTGALLLRFTGHTERVQSLAFSADGRLLVSAGEDQTVRVWSLARLEELILGQIGSLPGVAVQMRGSTLEVARVEADSPAEGKLRRGDVIAGMVEKGKLRTLTAPSDFYNALLHLRPGQKVTLRRGDPRGTDDVTLDVGQGADERKPLLSLFFIRADGSDRAEGADWIGWNPIGPYESSSNRAEHFLGWHFNTGNVRMPTRFALAAAHHKDYFQKGLLEKLVAQGELKHVEAPRLPLPTLVLWAEETGRPRISEGQGPLVVNRPDVTVNLQVLNRPLDSLSKLTWKLDDTTEKELRLDRPASAGPFTLHVELPRGEHRVTVTAWTRDIPPQPRQQRLAIRFRPPAPQLNPAGVLARQFTHNPTFPLKVQVSHEIAGEAVRVTLHHLHDGKELASGDGEVHRIDPKRPLSLAYSVPLKPGSNLLEVVAVNRDAPADRQAEETTRLVQEIVYVVKARPPLIDLADVRSPVPGSRAVNVEPLRPVVVHAPTVRLRGKATATENLAQADWFAGNETRGKRLTGFEPDRGKEFSFEEALTLRPGKQTFHLRARTATSDPAETSLTIDYQPLLPTVVLREPAPGTVLYGDKATATVRVIGRLTRPDDRQDYRAAILVNDREATVSPVIDEKAGTLTASVPVGPGEARIQVRLSNAWGMTADSDEVAVRYLRPPRFKTVKQVRAGGKPVLNLEARVRTLIPLLADSVKVEVNGQDVPAVRARVGQPQGGIAVLRIEDVPLEAGRKQNRIAVRVSNAEAECREPGTLAVETATVLPPPVVELLDPGRDMPTSWPELQVRYRVRSVSPLTLAHLVVEGRPPVSLDVSKARRAGDEFELTGEEKVTLARGINQLHLEAVNASGRRVTPSVVVTYVPPPFQLVVDDLEPIEGPGVPVHAVRQPRGRFAFPGGIDRGQVRITGHILWADEKTAKAAEEYLPIRVVVNGFQQVRVRLLPTQPGDPPRTPFEADLLLNWEKDNHVQIDAPGEEAGNPCDFLVDCRQPVKKQRLHLLVVSPQEQNADELNRQVLRAVQARETKDGRLEAPAFAEVRQYPSLIGAHVYPESIYTRLADIKRTILAASGPAPMNDVVMIYYQGDERGISSRALDDPGAGLPDELGGSDAWLVEVLSRTPGAHIMWLDEERRVATGAARPGTKPVALSHLDREFTDVRSVVVVRYAWMGRPPVDRRLIPVMGQVVSRAPRLGELIAAMGKVIEGGKPADLLVYPDRYVPADLRLLVVGKVP
jgi:WD40 repeat protein